MNSSIPSLEASPCASIDTCTTCSTCFTACPVSRATRRYNGPKMTGPSSQRFRLLSREEIEALDYCSNCKNCDVACPNSVPISTLNMLARARWCQTHKPPLRDWVLSHGHLLARFARCVPHELLELSMDNALTRLILDMFGIDKHAPMPVFAPVPFTKLFEQVKQPSCEHKAVFFAGCYINDYEPQVGLDTVWLLNKAGYEVVVPFTECCGVPLVANGFFDEARHSAERLIESLMPYIKQGIPIITACTSCSLMLRQEYDELFKGLDGVSKLSPLVRDAGEFLRDMIDEDKLELPQVETSSQYIYHEPCHLRVQGLGTPSLDILRRVGVKVSEAGAECCGISGSYGFKKEKYEVAKKIGTPLFESVHDAIRDGASAALCECGTCRLQIAGHTKAETLHPLSVLRSLWEKV